MIRGDRWIGNKIMNQWKTHLTCELGLHKRQTKLSENELNNSTTTLTDFF